MVPSSWNALRLAGAGVVLALAACTGLPKVNPGEPSIALESPPTVGVAGQLERESARRGGRSGVLLLEESEEALIDRLALVASAEKTLDIQYYIWSSDRSGQLLAKRLLEAADRGVRVRFLLDDVNFRKRDTAALAFASHPHIEVRIFNPTFNRSVRGLEFLASFRRTNKRMHNKILVMDNACAILGGRNVADEYFGLNEELNFRDIDVLTTGPVVRQASAVFDEFWNSRAAIPIENLVDEELDPNDLRQGAEAFEERVASEMPSLGRFADAAALQDRMSDLARQVRWVEAEVLADDLSSMARNPEGEVLAVTLGTQALRADRSLLIESAYFVPRDRAIHSFSALTERGVKVRVLTNSLASNDVIAAQAGHANRRPEVLRAGVEVYELRPDAAVLREEVVSKQAITGLHSKTLVIDEDLTFIGSYNLDPRSAEINSESGVLIRSRGFAAQVAAHLDEGVQPENAYRVFLDDRGRTRWESKEEQETKLWKHAPETTFMQRVKKALFSILPIENQL